MHAHRAQAAHARRGGDPEWKRAIAARSQQEGEGG